jgi:hypothetical protein
MASTLNASTSSGLISSGDTSGVLALQTNSGTTAVTIDTSQRVFLNSTSVPTGVTGTGVSFWNKQSNTSLNAINTVASASDAFTYMGTNATVGAIGVSYGNTAGYLPLAFYTSDAEKMRINTSGYVGIGTTAPETKVQIEGTADTVGATLRITSTGVCSAGMAVNATGLFFAADTGGFVWKTGAQNLPTTGGTERMRITSNGTLCLGTTSQYISSILSIQKSLVSSVSGNGTLVNIYNDGATSTTRTYNSLMRLATTGSGSDCNIVMTDNTSYNYFFGGYNGTAYVTVGNTQGVKLSAGSTSWASDSDERLKNIKEPITNALQNLSTLRTVYGNYKDDAEDVSRLFLIAQDVQKVYPEVIDVYQDEQQTLGLRAVDLIPVLVASIKELKAINDTQAETINALTARIVALEK